MVRPFGPIHERFEEYIQERTANNPSLIPILMFRQNKVCFRVSCKEARDGTSWSSWLDQAALDAPERVLIDQEISACLEELGYSGKLADDTLSDPAGSIPLEDEALPDCQSSHRGIRG